MRDSGVFTHALPERGELTIGRTDRCAICINDPRLSREHAILRVGAGRDRGPRELETEPASAIAGSRARPGARGRGLVSAGATVMIVQPGTTGPRLRHLWTHGYFEARVEDECARAEATGRPFAVARLRGGVDERDRVLARRAPPPDGRRRGVRARRVRILLPEVDPKSAAAIVARLRSELAAVGDGRTRVGLACWPTDGRTPEELISRAAPGRGDDHPPPAPRQRPPVPGGALDRLRPIVERVSAGSIPVLVVGETGVGKDLLATSIHALSPRARKPFVC